MRGAGNVEWYMPYLTKAASAAEVEYDWQPALEDRYWHGYRNTIGGSKDGSGWVVSNNSGYSTDVSLCNVYDLPGITKAWSFNQGSEGRRCQLTKAVDFPSPFAWIDTTTDGTTTREYKYTYFTIGFWFRGTVPVGGIKLINVQRSPWTSGDIYPKTPNQGKTVIESTMNRRLPANMADTEVMSANVNGWTEPTEPYEVTDWVRVAVSIYYLPDYKGSLATDHGCTIYLTTSSQYASKNANVQFKIGGITWNDGLIDGGMPFVSTDLDPLYQYGPHIYYDA